MIEVKTFIKVNNFELMPREKISSKRYISGNFTLIIGGNIIPTFLLKHNSIVVYDSNNYTDEYGNKYGFWIPRFTREQLNQMDFLIREYKFKDIFMD